ncbi:MAG: WbqC family protein [Candidatus Bathyarchaeia archaeon]
MKMITSGHQPNYLPYLGFFDKMSQCDIFVIQDDVQYERHDFQNRNQIKTVKGATWLSVPIEHVGETLPIKEIRIAKRLESEWGLHHWRVLELNYEAAPYWKQYCDFFEQAYRQKWESLMELNLHLIKGIMNFLRIKTSLVMASTLNVSGKSSDMILSQCKAVGADTYLSGIGGRVYLDIPLLENAGIKVVFQDFHYPVYTQLYGTFVPNLSIVDYLFCHGGEDWVPQRTSETNIKGN